MYHSQVTLWQWRVTDSHLCLGGCSTKIYCWNVPFSITCVLRLGKVTRVPWREGNEYCITSHLQLAAAKIRRRILYMYLSFIVYEKFRLNAVRNSDCNNVDCLLQLAMLVTCRSVHKTLWSTSRVATTSTSDLILRKPRSDNRRCLRLLVYCR